MVKSGPPRLVPCPVIDYSGERVRRLEVPSAVRSAVEACVAEEFVGLFSGPPVGSPRHRGGQLAADAALARFDVAGYAENRSQVLPTTDRGASGLSPYIRHGLLTLPTVWSAVADGPSRDVDSFRQELLWQEFARHWYARLGPATAAATRHQPATSRSGGGWDVTMPCLAAMVEELEVHGWLVNQSRMWLASDWAVRHGFDWREGEDRFFAHLLDGSRAANRLGWQWTVGVGSTTPYGFARSQVERRAPELCQSCPLAHQCPIDTFPPEPSVEPVPFPAEIDLRGPRQVVRHRDPEVVWLTAESLGHDDPALAAHRDLPVVFVFDEPLLSRLQLSAKRLVFLLETLAELGQQRRLELFIGEPTSVLKDRRVVVTHAPVPGFARRAAVVQPAEIHPWPWLVPDHEGPIRSFSSWRKRVRRSPPVAIRSEAPKSLG